MTEIFDAINTFDGEFSILLQRVLSHQGLDWFFVQITDLHKQLWFQLGVFLPLVLWWFYRERKQALVRFTGLVVTLILIDGFCGQVVKKWVARPRPFQSFADIIQKSPASGFSFVSNHTANMFGIAVFLGYFYPRWRLLWWTLAILVATSRVYNGVHFLTDVVGGAVIGSSVSFLTSRWLGRRFSRSIV